MPPYSGTKKILIVDFMYPLPENLGRRMRTMNFVRFFRKYGPVDLLYFYRESEEVEDKEVFHKEYFIRHPSCDGVKEKSWGKKVTGRVNRFLKKRPWMITEWPPQASREYISIINEGNYDIIFCRYILETSPLFQLPMEQRKRVVLDYDDIFSDSLYGYHATHDEKISSSVKGKIQKHFLFHYEKKCLDFGVVLFTTRTDREKVAGNNKKQNAFVVPNIYPGNHFHEGMECGYPKRNIFLFVGALNYGPNVEGLKWFIETIFQRVQKHVENPMLIVAGRQPTPEVKTLCNSVPNIELHPDVPDVKPFYQQSGVVIVPILTAGGTRIKILEAGIAGRPLLSTPMGAHGLDAIDGKDLFLFNDEHSFMEGYQKLQDKAVYDSMAGNMKSLVHDLYSPESFQRKMEEAIRSLM